MCVSVEMPTLVVTGFGPFSDVLDNPSSRNLDPISGATKYLDIPVSISGVDAVLREILEKFAQSAEVVLIQFGVHDETDKLRVEQFAYNEALFPIPDVDGVVRSGDRIRSGCAQILRTPIDVASLVRAEPKTLISIDPGRYLCNYMYFQSLRMALRTPHIKPLFVHVPPYSRMGQAAQRRVIQSLLGKLVYRPSLLNKVLVVVLLALVCALPLALSVWKRRGILKVFE